MHYSNLYSSFYIQKQFLAYYGGIYACYELAEEYLENGYSGGYVYDGEPLYEDTQTIGMNEEKDGVSIIWLPVSLLIGLLVGFLTPKGTCVNINASWYCLNCGKILCAAFNEQGKAKNGSPGMSQRTDLSQTEQNSPSG